jgi:hypothetical protein
MPEGASKIHTSFSAQTSRTCMRLRLTDRQPDAHGGWRIQKKKNPVNTQYPVPEPSDLRLPVHENPSGALPSSRIFRLSPKELKVQQICRSIKGTIRHECKRYLE